MHGPLSTVPFLTCSKPYFQVVSCSSYLFHSYPLQNNTDHRRNCQTDLTLCSQAAFHVLYYVKSFSNNVMIKQTQYFGGSKGATDHKGYRSLETIWR